MCPAKAAGATILMSIGGAAAGIDLSSSTVADRFVATVVPILQDVQLRRHRHRHRDRPDRQRQHQQLSTSQANLIRIIDGVLAQMPSNFGLTMAPETAYVTGGSVTYGSIWGAYLPIIKKYADNGRLWWLNMQYYNGSMYGCSGDSYAAGTVQGFTAQTTCLNTGLVIQGTTIRVPVRQAGPRPARAARRGRRLHDAVAGVAVLERLQRQPQGPDDLVDQLGRLEELDLRRQREAPAGPLTPRERRPGATRAAVSSIGNPRQRAGSGPARRYSRVRRGWAPGGTTFWPHHAV